jgi:dTDP-4-dehydrorhamnose reductase
MARVLLTGARGMLGRSMAAVFGRDHEVWATARVAGEGARALDVADEEAVRACVRELRPDWIVNAAAYTAVDRAESEEAVAFAVNAEAPSRLAEAAREAGACLLHVSTDFVFSGEKPEPYRESDAVGPRGAYARSKAEGEARVRRAGAEHVILRVAWLFGPGGRNFVDTILRLARERGELSVVDDQRGTPTFTLDAARLARRLLEAGVRGTVHGANEGVTTWCGLARAAVEGAQLVVPVRPIATSGFPTPAPRPANSALENHVLRESLGERMRPWQDALRSYLEGDWGGP